MTGAVPTPLDEQGELAFAVVERREKKLALDDPLREFFTDGSAAWHKVRSRHLLNHTSGIRNYGPKEIDFR